MKQEINKRISMSGENNPFYGKTHSEEARQKISQIHKGKKLSEETKLKISLTLKSLERKLSDEDKEKLRKIHKGKKVSNETREKLRLANLGRKMPEEQKQKIRQTMKGRKFTEEHKEKIKLALKGKNKSEEHKNNLSKSKIGFRHHISTIEKIRRASTGKKWSEEQKLKVSGKNNRFYGKHHLEETKKKLRLSKLGKNYGIVGKNHHFYGLSPEKNPNWRGGKSFEPYDSKFNNHFKEMIRERDNKTCINCSINQEEYIRISKQKQKLHIHHIDYNKYNTSKENCCTLCNHCNSIANTNRNYWTRYYQNLLSKKYGYFYLVIIPLQQKLTQ